MADEKKIEKGIRVADFDAKLLLFIDFVYHFHLDTGFAIKATQILTTVILFDMHIWLYLQSTFG